ncbi:hypothetical protein SAY87_003291 [Trapa incisa]|uniref:Protein kinase domain-containing protein n=1 Tax=Trapa incisa TaxID=236973 RepID=A0AAN7KKC9_9MYRT|nr:hypothetical protein SAY87_003291 [Trapa incisa]
MATKRFFGELESDPDQQLEKRTRTRPTLASIIAEVRTRNTLQHLCTALEPVLRRVVAEEVENGLRGCTLSPTKAPSVLIQALEPSNFHLKFGKGLGLPIFTGSKIVDVHGSPLSIIFAEDGQNLPATLSGPIKVELVVLDGDFPPGDRGNWTAEEFDGSIVRERAGKRPLLAGDVSITMRNSCATIGEIELTDNSSWVRSRKFRIGARVVRGSHQGGSRIREAITEAFVVRDHRGELYKKHYPPSLEDDVWRLEKIGKDGALHKKLASEGIKTVQDFLKMSVVDTPKLRTILGSGMSEKTWEATIKHAITCEMGNKHYVYSNGNCTIILNPICQMVRAVMDGRTYTAKELSSINKVCTAVFLLLKIYDDTRLHQHCTYNNYPAQFNSLANATIPNLSTHSLNLRMSASCFQTLSLHYLHLLFFFSSFYFISRAVESYASKDDPLYTECNIPFTCGPQWPPRRNVTYPFWGNRRARHCGVDGFELGCQDDEYPFMEFNSQKYRVLDIDQVSRVMTLARSDLWKGPCIASPLLNTAMDNNTLFDYPKGVKNISIFYCPYHDPDDSPLKFPDGIDCNVSDKIAILIADDAVDRTISEYADLDQCDRIKVPVLERLINETAPEQEKWEEVLRGGFNLTYRLDGGVCGSGSNNVSLKIGIGVSSGGVVLFMIIILCYFQKMLRLGLPKRMKDDQDIENFIEHHGSLAPKRFSYSQVKSMSDSFSTKLGQGGFGTVYKGKLPDGTLVAVKLLNASKGNGEEFINEVASISRTSHINIVTLLGFCYEGNKRALIYEFMTNGSLDKFLRCDENVSKEGIGLTWDMLYQIAVGIAKGVEYLHRGCSTRILHFDIKPQNILLDDTFCPKISNFGLSKLCLKRESIVSMMVARGTIGYIAPEVFSRNFGEVSYKSDVYSYGMMLMEMVGGRNKNPNDEVDRSSEVCFYDQVYRLIEDGYDQGLYSQITDHDGKQTVRKMALVGVWCIQIDPKQRPAMGRVIEMLEGSIEALPIPKKPFMFSPSTAAVDSSEIISPSRSSTHLLNNDGGSIYTDR